jgi:RNA polymerase sigma-70 factor (ECF subfamily)
MSELALRRTPHTDTLSDSELVSRVRNGEPALFELIMRRYNRRLFRIARSILGDDAEAQDAMQDAYVSAYLKLAQFRGPDGFASWLCQIVTSHALMQLRRRRRAMLAPLSEWDEATTPPAAVQTSHDDPESSVHEQQLRHLLEQAIDALPAVYRAAFVLREIEQLSVGDAARCLGIEEATVKTRVHRARRLLQRDLTTELTSQLRGAFEFDGARCDHIVARVMARIETLRA